MSPAIKPYLIPSHLSAERGAYSAVAFGAGSLISIWRCV
ncbi:hypothetical protein ACVXHA_17590 [Escherichia coli]